LPYILDPTRAAWFGKHLARFDVQLTDDIRMYNVKLIEGPRGRRVHAAHAFGCNTATFAPALAEKLVRAAGVALASAKSGERNAA